MSFKIEDLISLQKAVDILYAHLLTKIDADPIYFEQKLQINEDTPAEPSPKQALGSKLNNTPTQEKTKTGVDPDTGFPIIDRTIQREVRNRIYNAIQARNLRLISTRSDTGHIYAYEEVKPRKNVRELCRIVEFVRSPDPLLSNEDFFLERAPFSQWLRSKFPLNNKWNSRTEKEAARLLSELLQADSDLKKKDAKIFLGFDPNKHNRAFQDRIWPDARKLAGLEPSASPGRKKGSSKNRSAK